MFSNLVIGLLAGIGAGAWFYAKMLHQTGNDVKSSLIVAAGGGLVVALIFITVAGMITG